jgi:hypothetical protein
MVNELRKAILVAAALAAVLSACAPGQATPASSEQLQSQFGTAVAMTVQAQNNMATAVADTLTAAAPLPAATATPTLVTLLLPTTDLTLPTGTSFVVVPPSGGSGGGSAPVQPRYACDYTSRPFDNTSFKPGDPFDVKWVITNTGTKAWPSNKDFNFFSGTLLTSVSSAVLPPLQPGHSVSYSFDANAPLKKGVYTMQWKVEGGLCFPTITIKSGRPGDP